MKIGISACLLGYHVRYDGSHRKNEELGELLDGHYLIPICPELSAGFPIPHEPMEIKDNHVYTRSGDDVTDQLISGSARCYELVRTCDLIIVKSDSPSCGYKKIYDGSFSGKRIDGDGIFTRMCILNNKKIFTENDLDQIREYIYQ